MAFQDHGKVVKVLVIEPTYNQSKKHTSIRKLESNEQNENIFKGTLVALGLSPDLCSNKLL